MMSKGQKNTISLIFQWDKQLFIETHLLGQIMAIHLSKTYKVLRFVTLIQLTDGKNANESSYYYSDRLNSVFYLKSYL